MSNIRATSSVIEHDHAFPLVIAVTGHRDLVAHEVDGIRDRVTQLLTMLAKQYPDRTLKVMSALAEGADRLVAEIALDLGIELTVPLPMAKDIYVQDFAKEDSRIEFESLFNRAAETFELPVALHSTIESNSSPGSGHQRQYAQLGVFLCAHCHILLALWDGKQSTELGGTGQVVKFHHDDIMPGYTPKIIAAQQMLVDDESDLIYHIVCSRDRPEGQPIEGFKPLECSWFTKDRTEPRSRAIPEQHQTIFQRSSEFSRDAIAFAEKIQTECCSLLESPVDNRLPYGVDIINDIFCIADWLAAHYQKKIRRTLRATHLLAFMMGLMFILYSDLDPQPHYLVAFLLFFMAAAAIHYFSKRGGWQRKYLDYRALAEGLRVQFYWAVAGVASDNVSKFTHDNFLQAQDPELGWIRNVMRVAGTRCDAAPNKKPTGIDFASQHWIGDNENGQLGYYQSQVQNLTTKHRFTGRLGLVSLLTSVAVVTVLVFGDSVVPDNMRAPLMIVMGSMLLLFAVRQTYSFSTAEKELIKQYEFMFRIFQTARRRLDNTDDIDEQRNVMSALGGSALDEHAEWLLMHRDRSLDQGAIWRMGS